MEESSNKFFDHAFTKYYPIIATVTIDLLKTYNKKLNEELALKKVTTFLKKYKICDRISSYQNFI